MNKESQSSLDKITRAQSWYEIFPTWDSADYAFEQLLERFESEYQNDLIGYSRGTNELGNEQISFKRGPDNLNAQTTLIRFTNHEVGLTFSRDQEPVGQYISSRIIVASVGNIKHPYQANMLEYFISDAGFVDPESIFKLTGYSLERLVFHALGKPATVEWEEIFINHGYFPQRIGYHIYRDPALAAIAKYYATIDNQIRLASTSGEE